MVFLREGSLINAVFIMPWYLFSVLI